MVFLASPRHPYTLGLLLALPQGKWHGELKAVEGQPPDLFDLPRGCAFNPAVNGLCESVVVGFRWLQMLVKVTSLHVG